MKNVTESKEKFGLLIDLGIIKVPTDYDHNNQIGNYLGYPSPLYSTSRDDITDSTCAAPESILEPGDKIWVRIFKNCSNHTVTTKECKDFLSKQRAINVGVQGAIIVFKKKLQILPQAFKYVSFYDSEDNWSSNNVVFGIYIGEKYFWGLIRSKNRVHHTVIINDNGWDPEIAFFCITKC